MATRPHMPLLGRKPGTQAFRELDEYPDDEQFRGIVVLRLDGGLLVHGGYTDAWELVCCDCGDHPGLDCRDVSPELQRIRGPYTFAAGITAYGKHVNRYHRQQPILRPGPAGAPH